VDCITSAAAARQTCRTPLRGGACRGL